MKLDYDIAYCGLNCAKCDKYQESADKSSRECEGCRGPPEKIWNTDCIIRKCAQSRSVEFCYRCEKFVCTNLNEFSLDGFDHHRITVENLKNMKNMGLCKWLKAQKDAGMVMLCPGWIK